MEVSTVYPKRAKKLCHIKPGVLFQVTPNDGTTDHAFYLMTKTAGSVSNMMTMVNIRSGQVTTRHMSARGVEYPDAKIHLGDDDDN